MNTDEEFSKNVNKMAHQIVDLMKQKFQITKDEINELSYSDSYDSIKLQHILDSLLECIDFGMGEKEFFIIVEKLMKIDSNAADDYLKFYEEHKKQL